MPVRNKKQKYSNPIIKEMNAFHPQGWAGATYHQLFVNDHFADNAVNCGDLQLKHLREGLHAAKQVLSC